MASITRYNLDSTYEVPHVAQRIPKIILLTFPALPSSTS